MIFIFIILFLSLPFSLGASTPVNLYFDFESGTIGNDLTTLILSNGVHGSHGTISITGANVKQVSDWEQSLRGPVTVGVAGYTDNGSSRGIKIRMDQIGNYFQVNLASGSTHFTLGCYIIYGPNAGSNGEFLDEIWIVNSAGYFIAQRDPNNNLQAHGDGSEGTGEHIAVSNAKAYWITMEFVSAGTCKIRLYDPLDWSVVGNSEVLTEKTNAATQIRFGRGDNHSANNQPPDTSFDQFDDIIIDTSNAVFPLLPNATATYYVSTTGNDTNEGSSGSPWLTMQHACDTVTAGDTVRVQPGTYAEYFRSVSNGTPSLPITFVADGTVTLASPSSSTHGILDLKGEYQRWIGFTFDCKGERNGVLITNANHCEFWHNRFLSPYHDAFRINYNPNETTGSLFIGNYLTNGESCFFRIVGTNNYFAYNESEKPQNDTFYVQLSYSRILNNWTHGVIADSADNHTDFIQTVSTNNNMLYEGNLYVDSSGPNYNTNHHGMNLQTYDGGDCSCHIFRNNVWANIGSYCYDGDPEYYNFRIYNDTLNGVRTSAYAVSTDTSMGNSNTNISVFNCIFQQAWGTSVTTADVYTGTEDGHDYNIFYDTGGNINYGALIRDEANSLTNTNPQLTAAYRVSAGSAAIGAGGPLCKVTSANGTGTTFEIDRPGMFIGANTNINQYGGVLAPGDTITVGTDILTVTSVSGSNLTVNTSFTWAQNDLVYWGTNTTPDIGAIPYSSTTLTNAIISSNSTVYTVVPGGDARMVVFFADGIPQSICTSSPYKYTNSTSTVTARAYALYAQENPIVLSTTGSSLSSMNVSGNVRVGRIVGP